MLCCDSGWTSWEQDVLYTSFDLTSLLSTAGGPAAIGIRLGDGWYSQQQNAPDMGYTHPTSAHTRTPRTAAPCSSPRLTPLPSPLCPLQLRPGPAPAAAEHADQRRAAGERGQRHDVERQGGHGDSCESVHGRGLQRAEGERRLELPRLHGRAVAVDKCHGPALAPAAAQLHPVRPPPADDGAYPRRRRSAAYSHPRLAGHSRWLPGRASPAARRGPAAGRRAAPRVSAERQCGHHRVRHGADVQWDVHADVQRPVAAHPGQRPARRGHAAAQQAGRGLQRA